MPRRPILLALLVAVLTTVGSSLSSVRSGPDAAADADAVAVGDAAPPVVGHDPRRRAVRPRGATRASRSSSTSGARAASRAATSSRCSSRSWPQHAADGLAVVGVLTDDPVEPAHGRSSPHYGATWPTVVDPDKAIKAAYRVAARPQTYFVDRTGVIRSIQVGELTDADFERQYAADRAVTTGGEPAVVVDGLVKRYGARTVLDGVSLDDRGRRARRAARAERRRQDDDGRDHRGLPARRRRARPRPRHGPGDGRAGSPGAGRADAPGRRHRPARPAARDAPPVRPLPRRPARRRRAARPRRAARRRADALPAAVRRRAAAARARARARRAARGRRPRRADGRDGPGGAGRDPGDRRRPARRGRRDPADEPRPHRRRAAGRPHLHPRRRPDRRVRARPPSWAPGLRAASGSVWTGRWRQPISRRSGRAVARARPGAAVASDGDGASLPDSRASSPDAALVAALAAWCASADRLIVEMRTGGGTLEDIYLALVGEHAEVTP